MPYYRLNDGSLEFHALAASAPLNSTEVLEEDLVHAPKAKRTKTATTTEPVDTANQIEMTF